MRILKRKKYKLLGNYSKRKNESKAAEGSALEKYAAKMLNGHIGRLVNNSNNALQWAYNTSVEYLQEQLNNEDQKGVFMVENASAIQQLTTEDGSEVLTTPVDVFTADGETFALCGNAAIFNGSELNGQALNRVNQLVTLCRKQRATGFLIFADLSDEQMESTKSYAGSVGLGTIFCRTVNGKITKIK